MIFLTDTCFWTHLFDLYSFGKINLRKFLVDFKWGLTEQVLNEIKSLKIDPFFPKSDSFIIPLNEIELAIFISKYPIVSELDKADQTLVVTAYRDKLTILTDDGGLFMESKGLKISTLRLPHFCLLLTKEGILKKNLMYRVLKYWKTISRYPKQDLKKWDSILQKIS
ncbi:MAG: hypothetical protein ACTSVL_12580 [Promethearchaeota archaeon]